MKNYALYIIILLTSTAFGSVHLQMKEDFIQSVWKNSINQKIHQLDIVTHENNTFDYNPTFTYKAKRALQQNFQLQKIQDSQFVSMILLSKQLYILFYYDQKTEKIHLIGFDLVSTGNKEFEEKVILGQDHYFDTPQGVFTNQGGWRSDGKLNSDGITKGYGDKDYFIFYFGKQTGIRYNTFDQNGTKLTNKEDWNLITDTLQLAMHAHTSEELFGTPYSHGCIRISHHLNKFLDENLVLHKDNISHPSHKWNYVNAEPPKKMRYQEYAGKYLVIVDNFN